MTQMLYGRFPTQPGTPFAKPVSCLVQGPAFIIAATVAEAKALFGMG